MRRCYTCNEPVPEVHYVFRRGTPGETHLCNDPNCYDDGVRKIVVSEERAVSRATGSSPRRVTERC